jgi:hypothetical protein
MNEVFLNWPDLNNQPTGNPNIDYFTGGSSFVWNGTRFAGYAVVTLNLVTEAHLLCKRLNLLPSCGHSSSLQEYE